MNTTEHVCHHLVMTIHKWRAQFFTANGK